MEINLPYAAELLKTKNRILILTHKNPDGDAVGSAAGLARALRKLGKLACIHPNPGFTARYAKYVDGLCSTEDFEPEFVVSVDVADYRMLPPNAMVYADRVDLAIDHHESHREYAAMQLVDAGAAACGEIVYLLAEEMECGMDDDIASALYLAVATDTGCFLHTSTTCDSHYIAGDLLSYNVDVAAIHREFFVVKSRARLAIEARLIENMRLHFDGRAAVMHLPISMLEETGATEDDLDNVSALARTVEGVEVGVLIRELGGKCKLSMRSGESVNVSELCGIFGGGGHSRAAGCSIEGTPEEAEEKVIAAMTQLRIFA